ncbi:hypothetical protein L1D34_11120 [Vibrio mediterranei]|uniref:hypothetical protein n=1 Tax=Vibrio mediterranei TaxID=689 RepID=UPI001EFCD090|nr:hypothetical protein [Vibrio mediterranei]MCG9625395.1 hypothetical protein [Vibrio mediterranei]
MKKQDLELIQRYDNAIQQGQVTDFTPEEAECLGAFVEDALTEEDVVDSKEQHDG